MTNTTPSVAELVTMVANLAQALAELDRHKAAIPTQPSPPPERVLLTVEEAGQQLRIGKTKMYELVKSGELESVLIGRLRRIHIDSVKAYASRIVEQRKRDLDTAA
ncbi:excisionase family DNA-binding protein [Kutzneria sp. NPDC051319]|uniref:excisionase family DNA-binding protein n=1 Tax=Kutzneria sp. NPDC051319 TaxID=3155047 RepID=UPI0034326BC1